MRDLLDAVQRTCVIQRVNGGREAAMKAEKIDLQGSGSDLAAGDTPQSGYSSASAGIYTPGYRYRNIYIYIYIRQRLLRQ